MEESLSFLGLHLSGPNSDKTYGVLLYFNPRTKRILLEQVYEKIGSTGSLFSDERLIQIILNYNASPNRRSSIAPSIGVDCPISSPACVRCERPVCPGITHCEDVTVAYMLAIYEQVRKKVKARRKRLLNPQTQRVWDLLQLAEGKNSEPSYSSNKGPLVVRSQVLQKRLNSLSADYTLQETHILSALLSLSNLVGISKEDCIRYRNFEKGLEIRKRFLSGFRKIGLDLEAPSPFEQANGTLEQFSRSIEAFHALVTSIVMIYKAQGKTIEAPENYISEEAWVHVPIS